MNTIAKLTYAGAIALIATAMSSCNDFLTEDSKTAITESTVFSNLEYTESNLSAIYVQWRSNLFKDRWLWELWVGTDEVQSGAFQNRKSTGDPARMGIDNYDANLNSENGYISEQWQRRWPMVTSAAKIIKNLREGGEMVAGEKRAQLYGEACFIRGTLTMELASYWGEVPIIDFENIDKTGYGRQPVKDCWTFIINDLQEAVKYAPDNNGVERGNKYAAALMLGKALMAAPEETGLRDFAAARDALQIVLDGPYSLVPYADLFDCFKTNTAESILEWQFSQTTGNYNQVQFQIGSRVAAGWFGDKCYFSGYDHAVPTKYAYNTVENGGIWEDGDLRMEEALRFDFSYDGVTPDLSGIQWEDLGDDYDELLPHIKKYEDYRTDQHYGPDFANMWYSAKNIPWLRLADAILLHAECLNELGQTADAVEEVNRVRARAWGGNLPAARQWSSMSQSEFREKIMDERIRELFAEGWRRFDLIRTGNFVKLVKERNEWAKRTGTISDFHVRWPIPLTEIDQNEDIGPEDQNEGYR